MSCGVGRRLGWDLVLLWLWHRPAATAPIRPLAWEPPYAMGSSPRKGKKIKKKKSAEELNIYFSKKDMRLANRHRESGSTSLIKEMQIKTTMISPHTCENGSHQKATNKCWQGCEKREPWNTIGGNVNWCSHYENIMKVPQKIKNRTTI